MHRPPACMPAQQRSHACEVGRPGLAVRIAGQLDHITPLVLQVDLRRNETGGAHKMAAGPLEKCGYSIPLAGLLLSPHPPPFDCPHPLTPQPGTFVRPGFMCPVRT
jgi:hypothetical protein